MSKKKSTKTVAETAATNETVTENETSVNNDTGAQSPYVTKEVEGVGRVITGTVEDQSIENQSVEEEEIPKTLGDILNGKGVEPEEEGQETTGTEITTEETATEENDVDLVDTDEVTSTEITEEEKEALEESLVESEETVEKNNVVTEEATLVIDEESEDVGSVDVVVTGSETEVDEENLPPSHVVVTDNLQENPETADVNDDDDNVDPLPEIEGKFYINVGENLPWNRLQKVEKILNDLPFKHITTASGKILVGPFVEEKDAFDARKKVLSKGIKGIVVTME